jgi:hypothetical protein
LVRCQIPDQKWNVLEVNRRFEWFHDGRSNSLDSE